MHLAGDGPEPRPVPEPTVPTQHLEVNPENVVALAVLFRRCADVLRDSAATAEHDLHLDEPWLGDPVSEWAWEAFREYFLDAADMSFKNVIDGLHARFDAMAGALIDIASGYDLTEELTTAMMSSGGSR